MILNFTKSLIAPFKIGPSNIQVGVVIFGSRASIAFNLNSYQNLEDINKAIDAIRWKDEETNTSGALRIMHEEMFLTVNGDRKGAPNIGIVLTDGASTRDKHLTIPEARKAKDKGCYIITQTLLDTP